jgi:hypothetical protein
MLQDKIFNWCFCLSGTGASLFGATTSLCKTSGLMVYIIMIAQWWVFLICASKSALLFDNLKPVLAAGHGLATSCGCVVWFHTLPWWVLESNKERKKDAISRTDQWGFWMVLLGGLEVGQTPQVV